MNRDRGMGGKRENEKRKKKKKGKDKTRGKIKGSFETIVFYFYHSIDYFLLCKMSHLENLRIETNEEE